MQKNKFFIIILSIIIILNLFYFYLLYMRNKIMKVIVFDLDETLGHFVELGMFCDALEKYNKKKLNSNDFFKIMNIFPEFLRTNILKILLYLKSKKQKKECDKILIYTNNQGPKEWTQKIQKFFEKKINYKLFDQIIAAYKINGIRIEPERTTYDKTARDLSKCANLPENAQICFLDDLYHPLMENDNIYYIHVDPYVVSIPFNEMAERYYNSNIQNFDEINKMEFINYIVKQMNKYNFNTKNKTNDEKKEDEIISNEILAHLRKFFKLNKKKRTKKRKKKPKNITSKI